ncbi:MAG: enoyl-CoA hydratase/isomerase family protein [Novosphingobium sp.]|nr:enoyl-CoA hydratase/isomerase family protein [Novosphingobium sp.]
MSYETVLYEVGEGVATITLNRPQALNAFNRRMCLEFRDIWERIKVDSTVGSIVLRAVPGKAFSVGVDVAENGGYDTLIYDDLWAKVDPGELLGPKHNRLWKPMITAVNGMCAAGAFYWINESDIVICSDQASFFEPHVSFGLVAALEPIGLTYRIPLPEVLRMTIMGRDERISAETALRVSLVTEITAPDALWSRAHEIAVRAAAKPRAAMQGSIRAIWESLDQLRTSALQTGLKYPLLGNPVGVEEIGMTAKAAHGRFATR